MGKPAGRHSFLRAGVTLGCKVSPIPLLGSTQMLTSGPAAWCAWAFAEVSAARIALPEAPISLLCLQLFAFVKETFCVFNLEL